MTKHKVIVEDVEYHRQGDRALLGRLYRPEGEGPFPALVDVHGGAWVSGDRLGNVEIDTALARKGIAVFALDFRMPPEATYPASLEDINLGIRWLKAHARECGTSPDLVGGFGTSSGGHQILLAAMRPHDPRYAALPLPGGDHVDAQLAFVVSAYGIVDPLDRYHLVQRNGNAQIAKNHDLYWLTEEAMSEGSPALILKRGEPADLPPALLFQGTAEEFTTAAQLESFAAAYRKAGGEAVVHLLEGEKHIFLREKPDGENTLKAIDLITAFVQAHRDNGRITPPRA